jgi:hypothetical protein
MNSRIVNTAMTYIIENKSLDYALFLEYEFNEYDVVAEAYRIAQENKDQTMIKILGKVAK